MASKIGSLYEVACRAGCSHADHMHGKRKIPRCCSDHEQTDWLQLIKPKQCPNSIRRSKDPDSNTAIRINKPLETHGNSMEKTCGKLLHVRLQ
jgi:hypothetical protein